MNDKIRIQYNFDFLDGHKFSYIMQFDPTTMLFEPKPKDRYPDWTKLEHQQCSHCPLKKEQKSQCPVAVNMCDLVDQFKDMMSHGDANVSVFTKERAYVRKVTLQEGIQSIFGLVMATSECPHFNFLRPMARFHLPFSTVEETFVRSLGFYLLQQVFISKKGGQPDFDFKGLEKKYEALRRLNKDFLERCRNLGEGDADANAVIILDSFAALLSAELSSGMAEIEQLIDYGHLGVI